MTEGDDRGQEKTAKIGALEENLDWLIMDRASDGWPFRILVIMDEYPRECISLPVARRIKLLEVLDQLGEQFLSRGTPECLVEPFFGKPRDEWLHGEIVDTK